MGLRVVQLEQPVIEPRVGEVVQLTVNGGDQTGPAIAGRSKRGHPVFVVSPPLRDVVVRHLLLAHEPSADPQVVFNLATDLLRGLYFMGGFSCFVLPLRTYFKMRRSHQ